MNDALQAIMVTVRDLEAEITPADVRLAVRVIDTTIHTTASPYHSFLYNCPMADREDVAVSHLNLEELDGFAICRHCFDCHGRLLASITNEPLRIAAEGLELLRSFHTHVDPSKMLSTVSTPKDFVGLIVDYHKYIDATLEECGQNYYNLDPKYIGVIEAESLLMHDRFKELHCATVGSPAFTPILEQYAHDMHGVQIDRTPVKVAVDSARAYPGMYSSEGSRDDNEYEAALYVHFNSHYDYGRQVALLPRWAVQVFRKLNPGRVLSGELTLADEALLDTATKLWSSEPGEALFDFDAALKAAQKLLQ